MRCLFLGLGCAWCWRGWPAFCVDRRLSFLVWSCYWTYSHVPVTAFPISPRTLRRDRSTRVCVCPRLSGHPRGPSIGDGMDDKCTRTSPRVKTKNNGELVGRASWEVKAWGRCKPDHPLLLGDLGSRTHKTEKVKRRRSSTDTRKDPPIPATWDRAALCFLCAKHTTGGSTTNASDGYGSSS